MASASTSTRGLTFRKLRNGVDPAINVLPRPPILGYGAGAVRPAVPTGGPPYPHAPYGAGRGNYDAFRGQGGYPGKPRNRMVRGDPRAIVEYRDLDAPDDIDFF